MLMQIDFYVFQSFVTLNQLLADSKLEWLVLNLILKRHIVESKFSLILAK